jgi:pimeloyl-ACP methyl ester carboxylesterase
MHANEVAVTTPETHAWRAPALGSSLQIRLEQGTVEAFERGAGRPLVFAHGWLANANLWRHVVDALASRYRCITLDLPLGAHRLPVDPDADLTPAGCGALIAGAIEALDLRDVTLVGNDSGGAYSQIAVAACPERVGRLVLNSCETPYDASFPPEPFTLLPQVARDPEQLRAMLAPLEDRAVRMTPPAFGLLAKRPLDDVVSDTYALPSLRDPDVLRDVAKVMASASIEPVAVAGRRLVESFRRPVLFVWSPEDRVFPVANAERYAAALADGRVALVDDAYSFTPEDRPRELAEAIAGFVG